MFAFCKGVGDSKFKFPILTLLRAIAKPSKGLRHKLLYGSVVEKEEYICYAVNLKKKQLE